MEEALKILIMVDAVVWLIVILVCLEYWRKSKRRHNKEPLTEPQVERAQEPSSESDNNQSDSATKDDQEVNEVEIEGKIIKKEEYNDDTFTYYVQPEGQSVCYKFEDIEDNFTVGDIVKGDTDGGTLTLSKIKSAIDGSMVEVKTTNQ
jgi:hypothetical protein